MVFKMICGAGYWRWLPHRKVTTSHDKNPVSVSVSEFYKEKWGSTCREGERDRDGGADRTERGEVCVRLFQAQVGLQIYARHALIR